MRSARHMRIPREGCRPVGRWIVHLADLAVHQLAMSRPLLLDMFRAAVDDWLCLAGSPHDLGHAAPVGRGKGDFSAPDMLLRRVAIADNRLKPPAILRRDLHDNSCSHDESMNSFARFANRPTESDH